MPNVQVDLASALVTNRYGRKFGHLVRVIGGADFITLRQIEARLEAYQGDTDIKLRKGELQPILGLLIWHKYALFGNQNGRPVYKVVIEEILRISHYPRYLYHCGELFGDRGRSMVQDMLLYGRLDQQTIIKEQIKRELGGNLENVSQDIYDDVNSTFKDMIGTNFVQREPNLSEKSLSINPVDVPDFVELEDHEKYSVNGRFEPEVRDY